MRLIQLRPAVRMSRLFATFRGLVIYWSWNNDLLIAQQWAIMKRMGVKAS